MAKTKLRGPRCDCGHLRAVHTSKGCCVEQLVKNPHRHTWRMVRCRCSSRRRS